MKYFLKALFHVTIDNYLSWLYFNFESCSLRTQITFCHSLHEIYICLSQIMHKFAMGSNWSFESYSRPIPFICIGCNLGGFTGVLTRQAFSLLGIRSILRILHEHWTGMPKFVLHKFVKKATCVQSEQFLKLQWNNSSSSELRQYPMQWDNFQLF